MQWQLEECFGSRREQGFCLPPSDDWMAMYRTMKEKKPIKCGAVWFFCPVLQLGPGSKKLSQVPFGLFCCQAISLGAKMILPGAHCLNILGDNVKKNCCLQACEPCNAPSGSYTATWVESLNSANQAASNNGEHVSHSGGDQEKQMDF